jgi:hypothetical protein
MKNTIKQVSRWLLWAGLTLALSVSASAQYEFNYGYSDTLKADSTRADTIRTDTVKTKVAPEVQEADQISAIVAQATTWTRRLFYRGFFDLETTGTWATYQETDWSKKVGSSGPVRAHLTVNYLGASAWLGKPAEHLQVVYRTLAAPKVTVEFDLIVSINNSKLETIYRGLYRVDKGELWPADFEIPEGKLDYDKVDKPKSDEKVQLELYSGKYDATVHAGTGINAAKVYAYQVADLPPLDLVVLGYGNEALTYKSGGEGAEPRFEAPAPNVR